MVTWHILVLLTWTEMEWLFLWILILWRGHFMKWHFLKWKQTTPIFDWNNFYYWIFFQQWKAYFSFIVVWFFSNFICNVGFFYFQVSNWGMPLIFVFLWTKSHRLNRICHLIMWISLFYYPEFNYWLKTLHKTLVFIWLTLHCLPTKGNWTFFILPTEFFYLHT